MSVTMDRRDTAAALDEVADEAEEAAGEQKRLVRSARATAGQLRRGARWSDLADSGLPQRLLEGLTAGSARLGRAASRLRAVTIGALRAEGVSTRQVGRYLGISHQRVSTLQPRQDA